MEDDGRRLAKHVAEAADAWLRDPLDAGVYRRLVEATLAWRAAAGGGPPVEVVKGEVVPRGAPGPSTEDDERYLRPERAPQPIGSALADVASMLRGRALASRSEVPPSAGDHATPTRAERDEPALPDRGSGVDHDE